MVDRFPLYLPLSHYGFLLMVNGKGTEMPVATHATCCPVPFSSRCRGRRLWGARREQRGMAAATLRRVRGTSTSLGPRGAV